MTQYKVTSVRLAGKKVGDTVSETDLEGANIAALIEAGHIAEIGSKSKKQDHAEGE